MLSRKRLLLTPLALALALGLLMVLGTTSVFALFTNGGFENGDFTGWVKSTFLNPGLSGSPPFTGASIVRDPGGVDLTQIRGPFPTMSQSDPNTNGVVKFPLTGNFSAVINFEGANNNANSLKQQAVATAADKQSDGKVHIQFAYAPVLQNPNHTPNEQPYFYVAVKNVTKGNALLFETFVFGGQGGVPWQTGATSEIQFLNWQTLDIAPDPSKLAVGDTIELEAIGSGCSLGGHWGYIWVDGFGSAAPVPQPTPSPSPSPQPAPPGVPEPGSLALLASGLVGVGGYLGLRARRFIRR